MNMMNKVHGRSFLIVAACLALTACGGAPSESQMQTAVQAQTQREQQQMENMVGKAGAAFASQMRGELKTLHKIGCKEDSKNAYRCDVELEIVRDSKVAKAPMSLRFLKASDGWIVTR